MGRNQGCSREKMMTKTLMLIGLMLACICAHPMKDDDVATLADSAEAGETCAALTWKPGNCPTCENAQHESKPCKTSCGDCLKNGWCVRVVKRNANMLKISGGSRRRAWTVPSGSNVNNKKCCNYDPATSCRL